MLRVLLFLLDDVPFIYSDSGAHLGQAETLVPAYDRPLGYALFLRVVLAAHRSLHTVTYVQTALGILMVAGFIGLARRYVLRTTLGVLVFAALAAFDLRTMLFERWILSEALCMFLLLPYFFFLFRSIERGRWYAYVMVGVAAALVALVRNAFVFLLPLTILVVASFLPRSDERGLARRARAGVLSCIGFLPLLLGYAGYVHHHTGYFALTGYDGYSLWAVAGHPSICETRPWSEARAIVCRNEYAHVDSMRRFRALWRVQGPVRDLAEHYRNPMRVNAILREFAVESVRRYPFAYVRHTFWAAVDLFNRPVRFTSHMPNMLDDAGAQYVRARFGPEHPSVQRQQPPTWSNLKALMRVSRAYGILLIVATTGWLVLRPRRQSCTILLLWTWVYIAVAAMLGSGDADRLYVVVTMPLLLFVVGMTESLWQPGRHPT